ncbi:MAG: hypothetical protein LBK99_03500, partial [Opitutaceae bacterium]|jgi:type II secretory pathway pseudopilin PulG|nr:hypothetical protein [Opitutaceae bacterium]
MKTSMDCRHAAGAFTLIELLAIIAIIGVLAALVIATVGKARQMAARTEGIAVMRGIGQALLLNINDNNGRLPGPLYWRQVAYYREDTRTLLHHLAPYLGAPRQPTFEILPAYRPKIWSASLDTNPDREKIPIYCVVRKDYTTLHDFFPFGDPPTDLPPILIEDVKQPTKDYALCDIKKSDDSANLSFLSNDNSTIWGDIQHRLFFDAHVERRSL